MNQKTFILALVVVLILAVGAGFALSQSYIGTTSSQLTGGAVTQQQIPSSGGSSSIPDMVGGC